MLSSMFCTLKSPRIRGSSSGTCSKYVYEQRELQPAAMPDGALQSMLVAEEEDGVRAAERPPGVAPPARPTAGAAAQSRRAPFVRSTLVLADGATQQVGVRAGAGASAPSGTPRGEVGFLVV